MRQFLPLPLMLLINLSAIGQRDCRSVTYKNDMIGKDPGLVNTFQAIENFTRSKLRKEAGTIVTGADPAGTTHDGKAPDLITIPVVVHIVYNSSAQNISDEQVRTQIQVLNLDYRKLNADTTGIPGCFRTMAADCGFQFALANIDTSGFATTGIVRKHTSTATFDIDDRIKSSATGGDDGWDRDRYLNIWVGSLTGGILGYSSMPGASKASDGVVINYTAFGTTGTAVAPFNLGRTATHEIGHWLNMIHIWGDADCGDDKVDDTPPQHNANHGTPSGIQVTCGNGPYGDMYMDYMDFTDDIGMHMFTNGQRDRMRTLFAEGGFRYPLLSSNALSGGPVSVTQQNPVTTVAAIVQELSVYPNPARGNVSVNLSDVSTMGSVLEIYSQTGERLMSVRITALSFQMDLSSLPGGIYFIHVNGAQQKGMVKLVKI
jgi:hypothetical protein